MATPRFIPVLPRLSSIAETASLNFRSRWHIVFLCPVRE